MRGHRGDKSVCTGKFADDAEGKSVLFGETLQDAGRAFLSWQWSIDQ